MSIEMKGMNISRERAGAAFNGYLVLVLTLAMFALAKDFDVSAPVTIALCAIAVYVVASDAVIRLLRSSKP